MKIIICNSKNWFRLNEHVLKNNDILLIPNKKSLSLEVVAKFEPDFIFFPHWNWIVEKEIIDNFRCIAFHTAPLPFGRGGSPIQNLISKGFKYTPVCALKMTKEIDGGPIYDKEEISLEGSLSEIFVRLNNATNSIIERLICNLPVPKEQTGKIFNFKRMSPEDNEILSNYSFEKIYDIIRMVDDPSYPCAYLNLEHVKIEFSEIEKDNDTLICNIRILNKGKS